MALQKVSPYQLSHPRAFAISAAHSFNADHDVSFFLFLRASMVFGASQNVCGERAAALGWVPRPVVLEDCVDDGITTMFARMQ
jgi:hypothetical protein